ncbi:MAG TPA: hypothetical protein VKC34_10510 [Blastocatellia bacterium]|nr:hypothetical protein [Blastocatellia bacterium]
MNQIVASYKASLADANKTIKRLTSQNRALQKLVVVIVFFHLLD